MIEKYVKKLIENFPEKNDDKPRIPQRIDLVLDGGVFNGSYLVGALYFLKEMEKQNFIIIERISGCSIGSFIGFLYIIDSLNIVEVFYKDVIDCLKTNYNLSIIKNIKKYIEHKITQDICSKVNHKLYINYNNIKDCKTHVKCLYKNIDEIIDTIIKSCYIPFLIDNNLLYKQKYIDGLNPYIFKKKKDKKVLYIDLYGFGKISKVLNIRNEKTNYHRVLHGLLDIHTFYIKQTTTNMCSYIYEWNIINKLLYRFKLTIQKIFLYIIYFIVFVNKYFPLHCKDSVFYKIFIKILQDIYIILLENYCL